MPLADLTTLAAVRSWVGGEQSSSDDVILAGLVTAASRMCLNYINRSQLIKSTYVELYDGNGKQRMLLRNWPVASISSLIVNGITIAASTSPALNNASGYWLEPADLAPPGQMQSLSLYGYVFPIGSSNISLSYVAGYFINDEAQTISSGLETITTNQPYGPWISDLGVKFTATGVALTPVTGAPSTGQYQVVSDQPGNYKFAAADDGKAVQISYNYVPQDLFQAATELAGERYSYRSRIGQVSRSLGGNETTAFSLKAMPDAVKMMLDKFKNVATY